MSLYREDVEAHPDWLVDCMHCEQTFKASETLMQGRGCECPLHVRDVRTGEMVKCDGGFLDLDFHPAWFTDEGWAKHCKAMDELERDGRA